MQYTVCERSELCIRTFCFKPFFSLAKISILINNTLNVNCTLLAYLALADNLALAVNFALTENILLAKNLAFLSSTLSSKYDHFCLQKNKMVIVKMQTRGFRTAVRKSSYARAATSITQSKCSTHKHGNFP